MYLINDSLLTVVDHLRSETTKPYQQGNHGYDGRTTERIDPELLFEISGSVTQPRMRCLLIHLIAHFLERGQ